MICGCIAKTQCYPPHNPIHLPLTRDFLTNFIESKISLILMILIIQKKKVVEIITSIMTLCKYINFFKKLEMFH